MIKFIWWIIKNIIWGEDFNVDFKFSMSFEEALEYLRKGYFIREIGEDNVYYFIVNERVYSVNIKTGKVEIVETFYTNFTLRSLWYVIPMGKQAEGIKNDK